MLFKFTLLGAISSHAIDFDKKLLAGVMDARDHEAYKDLARPTTVIVTSITILAVLIAVIIIYLVTLLMIDESRNTISLLKVFKFFLPCMPGSQPFTRT